MKFPCLVRQEFCKTPITVTVYSDDISEDGEPIKAVDKRLMCNYQDSATVVLDEQHRRVEISGCAYFNGDIAENLAVISDGEVVIFGEKRKILRAVKARNPDGTVNYTKLELI